MQGALRHGYLVIEVDATKTCPQVLSQIPSVSSLAPPSCLNLISVAPRKTRWHNWMPNFSQVQNGSPQPDGGDVTAGLHLRRNHT